MGQIHLSRQEISDGIFFNHVFSDAYKTDYITLFLSVPLTEENACKTALISRVLLRGSEKYPDQLSLNRALDNCYNAGLDADVFKSGENQVLVLSASALADAYALEGESITEELLEILEDVIFRPYTVDGGFERSRLESEKENACQNILSQANDKRGYARKRMFECMCAGEAYAVDPLGREELIRAQDPGELLTYYRRFLGEAHIEIFHVGRGDPQAVRASFARNFARIQRRPIPPRKALIRSEPSGDVKTVRETDEVTQANLVLGFRTGVTLGAPDHAALTLFNAILGGSLTSKLFVNVREKLSLCYFIGSRPDLSKGVLSVACGIDAAKYDAALQEILRQLKLTQEGEITDSEFEQSANALINALTEVEETPSSAANWFYPRILAGDLRSPGELLQALKKVTPSDVAAVAKKVKLDTVYCLEGKNKEENHG